MLRALLRDLGITADASSYEAIVELKNRRVAESQRIDFKEKRRPGNDLAKSVAAMANAGGGVLVLGIRDENNRASEIVPLELDSELSSIQQNLAEKIQPTLRPTYHLIEKPNEPGRGVIIIEVLPAERVPYAVKIRDEDSGQLGYWIRVDQHTRGLSEPLVEQMYRERFSRSEVVEVNLASLVSRGFEEYQDELFIRDSRLVMAIVPSVQMPGRLFRSPTAMPPDRQERLRNVMPSRAFGRLGAFPGTIRPNLRRLDFLTGRGYDRKIIRERGWMEFYDDGSFLAVDPPPYESKQNGKVYWGSAALAPMLLMRLLSYYVLAREFGFDGDVVIRVALNAVPDVYLLPSEDTDLVGAYGYHELMEYLETDESVNVNQLAPLSSLVSVAKLLSDDVFVSFGWAECPLFTLDGRIALHQFPGQSLSEVKEWIAELETLATQEL